ncbi:hypothetical protein [Mycobacterium syngnathidarum]
MDKRRVSGNASIDGLPVETLEGLAVDLGGRTGGVDVELTRSEHRSWIVHRQLATHLTSSSLDDWRPTILANIERLRTGVRGQPHIANLDRWQRIVETADVSALRRALTSVNRQEVEMREVTPMGSLLPDDERRRALQRADSAAPYTSLLRETSNMTAVQPQSIFYLVQDGERKVALALEHDGRLYCYVPNVEAFVYNEPMSHDFLIDRDMNYEPIGASAAADIVKSGVIGRVDRHTNELLLGWAEGETRRLDPRAVLGSTLD